MLFKGSKLFSILLLIPLLLGACRPTPSPLPEQSKAVPTDSPTQPVETVPVQGAPTQTGAPGEQSQPPDQPEAQPVDLGQLAGRLVFAAFQEAEVQASPSLQPEQAAPDLSNVVNPFALSSQQIDRLAQDGFVVTPGDDKEFFTLYEEARYTNLPVFVTSDSLLHSYHLLFDKVLRTAEKEQFIPLLKELNAALLARVDAQYQALQGTAWQDSALRSVAFVSVASRLLDPAVQIPAYASELAEAELALVEAASGINPSPLFPGYTYGEDYTQYIPRGHYTMSEELANYFKSMMWYGRMTFRLKPDDLEAGKAETRSALLLVQALRTAEVFGRPAMEAWADLYSPTVFFVGRSDDLTVLQYAEVMDQVYGSGADVLAVADESKLPAFIDAADQLPPPQILGMVIDITQEEEATTKGMRLMGQRFVPDAYIFRQLIFRNVGTLDNPRSLPMGLDIPAAMGSERAYTILDELGETQYANYPEQMTKMRDWLSGLDESEWTETLYNAWIYSFYPLLDAPGEGYPAFMQSDAWLDKQLNTTLGSWAELKHDTILYAKQVYAELGGGMPAPEPVAPLGYVEPVPAFYARLSALAQMTIEGLESRRLLNEADRSSLQRLVELSDAFKVMAEKELNGEPLTAEEQETIRFYGGELEHFVMASADKEAEDEFAQSFMEEEPQAAVIADVATNPDGMHNGVPMPVVLEEGVGRINAIHVVAPIVEEDGSTRLQVVKGGVFSYYEFSWPGSDRLTDEKWRQMLDSGEAPDLPSWTSSFYIPEGENTPLQAAVFSFQRELTNIYWDYFMFREMPGQLSAERYTPYLDELEGYYESGQYVGHQLIGSRFISYDRQSEQTAVVTVRETWSDTLYEGEQPDSASPVLGRRGPYTLDVTYTLEAEGAGPNQVYTVTQVSYTNQAPAWEMQ